MNEEIKWLEETLWKMHEEPWRVGGVPLTPNVEKQVYKRLYRIAEIIKKTGRETEVGDKIINTINRALVVENEPRKRIMYDIAFHQAHKWLETHGPFLMSETDYFSIWGKIRDLPLQTKNTNGALIKMLKENYGSFDAIALSLSKYIIKTGFCARIGKYNKVFIDYKNKYPDYQLKVAGNLIIWAQQCYPLLKWYNMVWDKIHAEIMKTYNCLCRYIPERYGIKDCPNLGSRKAWISTSRTYPGQKGMSKINIGVLGVLSESKKHRFDEYPTVAKALYKQPIKDESVYYIKLKQGEYYLAGVLALTHEMAHFVANTLYPHRKTESGKRAVHDVIFLKVYFSLLQYLVENFYPELGKYVRERVGQ